MGIFCSVSALIESYGTGETAHICTIHKAHSLLLNLHGIYEIEQNKLALVVDQPSPNVTGFKGHLLSS